MKKNRMQDPLDGLALLDVKYVTNALARLPLLMLFPTTPPIDSSTRACNPSPTTD